MATYRPVRPNPSGWLQRYDFETGLNDYLMEKARFARAEGVGLPERDAGTAPRPRRFGCAAAPAVVFLPKARTAWTESLDRFWVCPKIFFAQCSYEDSG